MMTDSGRGVRSPDPTDPTGTGAPRAPRRFPWHVGAPIAVALSLGGILLVTGWRTLAPVRAVEVAPVVIRQVADRHSIDPEGRSRPDSGGRSVVTVQAPGWLEADPFYVACTALADGVVEELLVLEGERVERGQVVARLVDDDAVLTLAGAEAELEAARADLGVAEADLQAAQTDWDHPIERTRAVESARATLAETEAMLRQLDPDIVTQEAILVRLQEERDRVKTAVETGATNDIELIRREQELAAQRGMLDSTRARRDILEARCDRQRAELQAAEENLRLRIAERRALDMARSRVGLARASVARAQARRDEAALRLSRMTISAPISGYVQTRLKVPGDKVMLGSDERMSAHIVHLYDPEKLQVRVDVPLADAAHVFVGQRCQVIVDVLPETEFEGVVTRITHEADIQKNTLQAKVAVLNPSALLRPEMLTRVKFLPGRAGAPERGEATAKPATIGQALTAPTRSGAMVPEASIEGEGVERRVWVVRHRNADRGSVYPVSVEPDSTSDGWTSVRAELREGDLVVASPQGLRAGQPVRLAPAGAGEGEGVRS